MQLSTPLAIPRVSTAAPVSRRVLRAAKRYPLGAASAVVLLLMVVLAVFAPFVAPYDPLAQDIPSRMRSPNPAFWLGTDTFGRDVFSRIIFGARISLYVGLSSVALSTVVGTLVGIASGYWGGKADLLIQRIVDALMGFPYLVLVMAVVIALGPSINNVALALAVGFAPRTVRIARSSALSVKAEVYVLAAEAMGCRQLAIMLRHVLPNCLAPVFVVATGFLGTAIVSEASLSFLGLGVPPPHPSWGGMLREGSEGFLQAAPWLSIFPGVALSVAVFSFSYLGDALRDALDPRLRA